MSGKMVCSLYGNFYDNFIEQAQEHGFGKQGIFGGNCKDDPLMYPTALAPEVGLIIAKVMLLLSVAGLSLAGALKFDSDLKMFLYISFGLMLAVLPIFAIVCMCKVQNRIEKDKHKNSSLLPPQPQALKKFYSDESTSRSNAGILYIEEGIEFLNQALANASSAYRVWPGMPPDIKVYTNTAITSINNILLEFKKVRRLLTELDGGWTQPLCDCGNIDLTRPKPRGIEQSEELVKYITNAVGKLRIGCCLPRIQFRNFQKFCEARSQGCNLNPNELYGQRRIVHMDLKHLSYFVHDCLGAIASNYNSVVSKINVGFGGCILDPIIAEKIRNANLQTVNILVTPTAETTVSRESAGAQAPNTHERSNPYPQNNEDIIVAPPAYSITQAYTSPTAPYLSLPPSYSSLQR